MKKLISIVLAAGVGFAAAYFFVSNQVAVLKDERAKLEAQWQSEKADLEKALAGARNKAARVEQITKENTVTVSTPQRSANEIIEKLLILKPGAAGASRIATIRKIVHELEDLAELKEEAVPAIRDFFARNMDIDYAAPESSDDNRDRRGPPWSRRNPPTEFSLPPSLRIGLFDVLKEIKGGVAEQALVQILSTTGRAVEVAYVAHILEEIAPAKYRDVALEAAKSLLRNPLPIDNPNRLDESAESYLFGVLEMYHDTSFGDEAAKLMIADGKLDRNARDYLMKTQGEKAIPVLYDAYKNTALTNSWDKASVASRILDYVGSNEQANKFLNEIVLNPDIDSRMRSFAIMRLAGGFGDVESPKDPDVIKSRMALLGQVAQNVENSGIADERLVRAIERTGDRLKDLEEGKDPGPIDFRRGGDWQQQNGQNGPLSQPTNGQGGNGGQGSRRRGQ